MRSNQIKSTNQLYPSAVNNKVVEAKEFNELQLDVKEIRDELDGYSPIMTHPKRVNDGDDTFTGSGILYEIDCHYQIDSLGSTQEYLK